MRNLTSEGEFPLNNFKDCIDIAICEEPNAECYLKNCTKCPGVQKLREYLDKILSPYEEFLLSFKQWVNDPQCTLETFTKTSTDFVDFFCDQIDELIIHDYICKEQSAWLRLKKENLKEGEFIIIKDFAQNYGFVVQDAAQGFHWNNNQATIYPVVAYYRENGVTKNKNYVITSDNLSHDAVAVYTFTKLIIEALKNDFEKETEHRSSSGEVTRKNLKINKIFYVSDGAPQQFKNFKNIFNVHNHIHDFGIDAEWHFFPTAHGKGPCDGLGGTVKRCAASASLQLPYDKQILTPLELHEWFMTCGRFKDITFLFSPLADYKKNEKKLKKRFSIKSRVQNLRQQHAIIPDSTGIKYKIYSNSTVEQLLQVPSKF